jgi:hypothetical protein
MPRRRRRSSSASARDLAELRSGSGSAGDRAEAGMGKFTFKKVKGRRPRKKR